MMYLIKKELMRKEIENISEVHKLLFLHPDHNELACEIYCNQNRSRISLKATYVIPHRNSRSSPMTEPLRNIAISVNRFNQSHDSGCLVCKGEHSVSFRMSTYLPEDPREASIIISRLLEDFFEECSSMYLM